MPIDRVLWKRSLTKFYAPAWPCPSCADGRLRLKRETLRFEETAQSQHQHSTEDLDPRDISYVFSAILECTHCNEMVSCCGDGGFEPEESQDEDGNPDIDYRPLFFVRYFSKPMLIFSPPTRCPDKIKKALYKSFSVLFCDVGAAANHVRQCAEEILTHAGIDHRNARGKFIPLERRIRAFEEVDHENAGRVSALRWIGNFGSHPENLTRDNVFDAYDILEVLLEDMYVGHHRSVRELVDRINRERHPTR